MPPSCWSYRLEQVRLWRAPELSSWVCVGPWTHHALFIPGCEAVRSDWNFFLCGKASGTPPHCRTPALEICANSWFEHPSRACWELEVARNYRQEFRSILNVWGLWRHFLKSCRSDPPMKARLGAWLWYKYSPSREGGSVTGEPEAAAGTETLPALIFAFFHWGDLLNTEMKLMFLSAWHLFFPRFNIISPVFSSL